MLRSFNLILIVFAISILTFGVIGCGDNKSDDPISNNGNGGINLTPDLKPSPTPSPTPTPVATPSPVPSPTPEVTVLPGTPEPVGEPLFSDDFNDRSDNWVTYSDAQGIAYYKEGRLHVQSRGITAGLELCLAKKYYDDFVLDVEEELVKGVDEREDDQWCVIACRVNNYRGY